MISSTKEGANLQKKFLLRLTEENYQTLVNMAGERSLNQYLNEIGSIPELKGLLNDPEFADEILDWEKYQIVVISEVTNLENPLPLTKEYINHPRIIVNRETTIAKLLGAKKIDDLFLKP